MTRACGLVRWSPAEDEQLRKLAQSGVSLAEIAARMERSKSSVRTRALKMNIAIARDRNPSQKGFTASIGFWKSKPTERLRAARASVSAADLGLKAKK